MPGLNGGSDENVPLCACNKHPQRPINGAPLQPRCTNIPDSAPTTGNMQRPPNAEAAPGKQQPSSDKVEKRQWVNTAVTLQQKVAAAERLATIPLDVQSELEHHKNAYSQDLQKLQMQLQIKCDNAKRIVSYAQSRAANCKPDSDSITALAEVLEKAEEDMSAMKDKSRVDYNDLMDQEDVLQRDLEMFVSRMSSAAWEEVQQPEPSASKPKQKQATGRLYTDTAGHGGTLLPEVVAFEEYRAEFGDTGNWHPEEHKEFVRILKQCKHDYGDAVRVCCERILVGFEREDIIAHARWHQEYVDLEIRKRLALAEWKEQRAQDKEAAKQSALSESETARRAREYKEQKEAEQKAWRAQQKEALEEWKLEKQRTTEEEGRRLQEEQDAAKRAKARETEVRLMQKAMLEEQRLLREAQTIRSQQEQPARPQSASASISQEQKDRIRERERKLEQQRIQLRSAKMEKEEKEAEKERLLRERLAPKIDRDVSRLLGGTTATRSRQKAQDDDRLAGIKGQGPGFIRHVPKLAIPSYMRR